MDTGAVSGSSWTTSTGTSSDTAKKAAGAGQVSKDDFLQLLVAQLKNQDPMEPMKNENFLAQLATFSSLEQLVAIKDGIDKLAEIANPDTQTGDDSSTITG